MDVITFAQFRAMVDRIMALGISEDLAGEYASLIGDVHFLDENGNVMVFDLDGRHLATLPASIISSAEPPPNDD